MTHNERVLADPNTSTAAYREAWNLQREHEAMLARIRIAAEDHAAANPPTIKQR